MFTKGIPAVFIAATAISSSLGLPIYSSAESPQGRLSACAPSSYTIDQLGPDPVVAEWNTVFELDFEVVNLTGTACTVDIYPEAAPHGDLTALSSDPTGIQTLPANGSIQVTAEYLAGTEDTFAWLIAEGTHKKKGAYTVNIIF
jgi:hypothetical protein